MTARRRQNSSLLRTLLKDLAGNAFLWISLTLVVSVAAGLIWFRPQGKAPNDVGYQITFVLGIACLVSLISTVLDRNYTNKEFATIIRSELREADQAHRSIAAQGIVRAHDRFDFKNIFDLAGRGDVVWWLDTYCPLKDAFLEALRDALGRGAHIRMLVIDKDSQTARYRSEELAGTPDTGNTWQTGLMDFQNRMQSLAIASNGALELRSYADLPGMPIYVISRGGEATAGFFSFFLTKPSAHFVHFEIAAGPLINAMFDYVENKWKRSRRSIPAEDSAATSVDMSG